MTDAEPRYLVPIHPKRIAHFFTDVLIIGGGLAGARAAIACDPRLSVLIVTKESLQESNSQYAQGGIAGVLAPEDRFENHIEDTLRAGGDLCDVEVVKRVVYEAPERINELIAWGTHFDEQGGTLALGREGGHSHNRVAHALGDATGKEIMRAVIARLRGLEHVTIWEDSLTLDLLTHKGACRGALVASDAKRKILVWAKQTIICTGGAGQVFRETTNPEVATGDGIAACYRAGARLRDMEFMQFHPTVLYIAGSSRHLITEAVRGAGAHLVDCDGVRFMPDFHPDAELAPRDVVSQAIVVQMAKTRHPNVYLDLSHLDADVVQAEFPGIVSTCAKFGIDVTTDRIPVQPAAHYLIGGIEVDDEGRTSLPGLWAAGEVTSSGLHGANRLASNSLLEGLVYGAHAGEAASQLALSMPDDFRAPQIESPTSPNDAAPLDLADISNSLKSLMWRNVGIRRDGRGLTEARDMVARWCRYVLRRQFDGPAGWELQNMLTVAKLMIEAALLREESRGVHYRADFPDSDDVHWRCHISQRRDEAALTQE
ncbi:MAG: L-aspartate oxidase [Pirellulales bacterium]